jgi:glycine/D-amino acid oxidase-like deaminating enzyme
MRDAVVIGGGFYGASIAHYLKTRRSMKNVLLVERGTDLLTRSSFVNQARVHGGYHYPRSFTTAYRSRVNLPLFSREFSAAMFDSYDSIYAIARRNSKVTAVQMERFCQQIGASLTPAPKAIADLFDPQMIERAYLTVEHSFNADALRDIAWRRLCEAGVEVWLGADVEHLDAWPEAATVRGLKDDQPFEVTASQVFNCAYSRLQRVVGSQGSPDFRLRHEITELVLIEPPPQIKGVGVTVMDGPFFSTMPFPARNLHSLTHVRYTPHIAWNDGEDIDPYKRLEAYALDSRVEWMIRDSARYLPCLTQSRPVSTLFEVKTVLRKSEGDDSRPILFERHGSAGRIFSILGGKIDNIYDILEKLDTESFDGVSAAA